MTKQRAIEPFRPVIYYLFYMILLICPSSFLNSRIFSTAFSIAVVSARRTVTTPTISSKHSLLVPIGLCLLETHTIHATNSNPYNTDAEARTGWWHSQPKNSTKRNEDTTSSSTEEQPSRTELRTGWLHRSSPRDQGEKGAASSSGKISEKESAIVYKLRQEMIRKQRNHRIISPPTFYPSGEEGRVIVITEHVLSVPLSRSKQQCEGKDEDMTKLLIKLESEPTIDVFFTVIETIDNEADEQFFRKILGKKQVTGQDRAAAYVRHANLINMEKGILYLQGGPGFGAPTPISGIGFASKSSWAGAALSNGFKRVVLMDQRGTGRSSPVTKQTLEARFPDLFLLDKAMDPNTVNNHPASDLVGSVKDSHPEDAERISSSISNAVEYISHFRADSIVQDAEAVKDALLWPASNAEVSRHCERC